jgi:D-alanyl-D-alanine carboxypeptidase/D-alanyl-D-alanine-endopeptidase (penicillin-binding protein 4)
MILLRGAAMLVAVAASGAGLGERIEAVLDRSPGVRNAHWGILLADSDTGQTLYARNSNRFFIPASNTKLFSTALALARLGAEHRFRTRVLAAREPDANGRVSGALILAGGGDPNLSGRALPYDPKAVSGNPLAAIEDLASQLVARGVRSVSGDIVGDDTAYVWEPFPDGWSIDDPLWEFGAPVSALSLNDNAFQLTVAPGARAGDAARVSLAPALDYYRIDNRIATIAAGERRVRVDRQPGSSQLRLWGTLPLQSVPRSVLLGVDDPALFAAMALRDALSRRGVNIAGRALARHRFANELADLKQADPLPPPAGILLASRASAPLLEDLRVTNKVSQNLHAELALRAVARERRGIGSREAGLEELRAFLAESGIEEAEYEFFDGSGLSRLNLISPAAVVKLLAFMLRSPHREHWLQVLPVGGEDGTLTTRFTGTAAAGRVRAKTGSLTHVSALSGYAERASGGVTVFAILVNNYRAPASEIRAAIDTICNLLVE